MPANGKWRKRIELPATTMAEVEAWTQIMHTQPQTLLARGKSVAQVEDNMLYARWNTSPRLIFRVSRRIVKILTESFFEDVCVRDIFFPEGTDVLQIIPEQDDPICKHSLMFFLPTEEWPNYYLIASDATGASRLRVKPEQKISDFSHETITAEMVDPNYLALIAAIGFVADSDEYGLIRHLVLNRDTKKYEEARISGNAEAMRRFERRAIKRNKNERIVDTYSMELGEVEPMASRSAPHDPLSSKRPHIRRGHFRKVRHGPGMKLVRYQWFPPVVVRRDLLSDEEERLMRPNG